MDKSSTLCGVRFARLTAPASDGAIGMFGVWVDDERGGQGVDVDVDGAMDALSAVLGSAIPEVGGTRLGSIAGVDEGVIARLSQRCVLLCPHASVPVMDGVVEALEGAGVREVSDGVARWVAELAGGELAQADSDRLDAYENLCRAASPFAVDALLGAEGIDEMTPRGLGYVVDPALVVLVGPTNVGKSTLTNTLARRSVSVVADRTGTTRDHVGVRLDVAGVVVRFVDTPGFVREADAEWSDAEVELQTASQLIAQEVAERADVLVIASDASGPVFDPPWSIDPKTIVIRIGLRADLCPGGAVEGLSVSAQTGMGIAELVALIRSALMNAAG